MTLSTSRTLRIAFIDTSDARWVAGIHYLKNLWAALRLQSVGARPEIVLLVSDKTQVGIKEDLGPYIDQLLRWPPRPPRAAFWHRQAVRIRQRVGVWLGPWPSLSSFLHKHGIDCVFARTQFGPRFSLPLLTWIPDFQYLHLPEMFSAQKIRRRNIALARVARYADRIVLSSQDAFHDFEHLAPQAVRKARVLPFVAQIPADTYDSDPAWVCDHYHLPRRFVYLPNQFWAHKNHKVVVQALALAKAQGSQVTVVCTGSAWDHRNPWYFSELLATISELGLRDNLILLGFIPHAHLFQLMRQSLAVLQPSLFEGWSTTVEEAKSVGKSVILSDIPVHREQNPPQVTFFDPRDPKVLADCLVKVFDQKRPGPDHELEASARASWPLRAMDFGRAFVEIVQDVVQR